MKKTLYIIAGCNGAGKTTASFTILPEMLKCKEFVNADEIARGISPFQPDKVSIEAGRIMLNRIENLIANNHTFAFETTLASKSYRNTIEKAQLENYKVVLLFFWLNNVEIALQRVKTRVAEGGHNIDTGTIIRRYSNGIKNLFELYIPIVDELLIIDNSTDVFEVIAEKIAGSEIDIINMIKYNTLKNKYHETTQKK